MPNDLIEMPNVGDGIRITAVTVTATVTATAANYSERRERPRTDRATVKYSADVGERPRTVADRSKVN